MTRNGIAPIQPNTTYCGGNKAAEASANTATTAKLIHHGDRSRIANSEFSAIFSFTQNTPAFCPDAGGRRFYHDRSGTT